MPSENEDNNNPVSTAPDSDEVKAKDGGVAETEVGSADNSTADEREDQASDDKSNQPEEVPADTSPEQGTADKDQGQPSGPSGPMDDSAGQAGSEIPDLPDFSGLLEQAAASSIDLLNDVELDVKIELGRAEMEIEQILHLSNGSVIELDKLAGDPVDVLVNEQLIARGEVLVINDNFCVRINEILPGRSGVSPDKEELPDE
jgi:flagellar motor switch protein FliN